MSRRPARRRRAVLLVLLLALLAMALVGPTAADAHVRRGRTRPVEVLSYNLYLGADLTPLFGVGDVAQLARVAAGVWNQVGASAPPERMDAVARIVARERPDLVALQEVALWESAPYQLRQTPQGTVPVATGEYRPVYDFLDLLLHALADRGEPYDVVSTQRNFSSAQLPFAIPVSPTDAVRFTDRDVILVRRRATRRLTTSAPASGTFQAQVAATVQGVPITVPRGWASVDVTLRDGTFRLFDTHLEAFGLSPLRDEVRNPQAVELAAQVADSPHPVVVAGDLNARPTQCATWRRPPQPQDANVVAYRTLEEAGLRESWPAAHPGRPCDPAGWTSGFSDLAGPDTRTNRIDHVFADHSFTVLQSRVVGDEAFERTRPSGLWPSDHAGALAAIRLDGQPSGRVLQLR